MIRQSDDEHGQPDQSGSEERTHLVSPLVRIVPKTNPVNPGRTFSAGNSQLVFEGRYLPPDTTRS
jgi:hypothetical protein